MVLWYMVLVISFEKLRSSVVCLERRANAFASKVKPAHSRFLVLEADDSDDMYHTLPPRSLTPIPASFPSYTTIPEIIRLAWTRTLEPIDASSVRGPAKCTA